MRVKSYLLILFLLLTKTTLSQNSLVIADSINEWSISLSLDTREKDDFIEVYGVVVEMNGPYRDYESNDLIIMFVDGSRIVKKSSRGGYRISNTDWFYLNEVDVVTLATKKVSRIFFMNGLYLVSIEETLHGADQSFFIEVLTSLKRLNMSR